MSNCRCAGGVAEGGDWRKGEREDYYHLANCMIILKPPYR